MVTHAKNASWVTALGGPPQPARAGISALAAYGSRAKSASTSGGQLTMNGEAAAKISDGFLPSSKASGKGESPLITFR